MTDLVLEPDLESKQLLYLPDYMYAMTEYTELTAMLEYVVTFPGVYEAIAAHEWHRDADIVIGGGIVRLLDVGTCDPCKVRLVLMHLPGLRVEAMATGDPHQSGAGYLMLTDREREALSLVRACTEHPIAVKWEAPDGTPMKCVVQ